MKTGNVKLSMVALLLLSISCTGPEAVIGIYEAKNSSWSQSKMIIGDSSRFVWSELYEGFPIRTSGIYKIEGDKLSLYSDDESSQYSDVQYLDNVNHGDSIYIEVLYRNLIGEIDFVPASIVALYDNGVQRALKCGDDGRVGLGIGKLQTIAIKWIAGWPIEIRPQNFKSNNLRIVLVEDSRGNTSFNGKSFTIQGNKLIEKEGDRVFKRN
uniref:hypothetical protein n=1 Tax=Roseivirga sp. TaxID=1964215 RepID=UPI004047D822